MAILRNFALLVGLFGAIGVNGTEYRSRTVTEGKTITMYCGGDHDDEMHWDIYKPKFAKGKTAVASDTEYPSGTGPWHDGVTKVNHDNSLTVKLKYPRDQGVFVCWEYAPWAWGWRQRYHYTITINVPPVISHLVYYFKGPSFTNWASPETIVTGDTITLDSWFDGGFGGDHFDDSYIDVHVKYNGDAPNVVRKWRTSWGEYTEGIYIRWYILRDNNGTKVNLTLMNEYGSDTRSVTMIVHYKPRFTGKVTGNHAGVIEHRTLTVTPHVDVNPANYSTVWMRNGEVLSLGRILQIVRIKRKQAGKYWVTVANYIGWDSESFDVIVYYPPSAKIIKTSNYIVCKVTLGHPTNLFFNHFTHIVGKRVVRWRFRDKTTTGNHYHTQKIRFHQTRYVDAGLYSCGVWNEWRGKRVGGSTATLTVKTKSLPVKVQSTSELTICRDETRDISVIFYTESKYTDIKWIHKDGRRVNRLSKRVFIVRRVNSIMRFHGYQVSRKTFKSVLLIRDASKESAGTYTLRVTNAYGTTNIDVTVKYDSSSDPWKHITFGNMNFCSLNTKSECYTCESNGPTPCDTPVRKIGDKIQVSCTKEVAFPTGSTKPNTFRWFISGRNGNHNWQEIPRNEKVTGSRPTYKKVGKSSSSGSCYPTNIKTSTLTFTGTANYLKQLKIRCVVSYKYGESRSVRFVNMSLCLIGGVDKSKKKIGRLVTAADVDTESVSPPILGVGIAIPIAFLSGCVLSLVLTAIIVRQKDMVRRSTQCETDKTVFVKSDPSNNKSNNAREKIGESCDGTDQEEACQSSLCHTSDEDRRNTDGEINMKPAEDGEGEDGTRPTDPGDHPVEARNKF